MDSAPLPSLNKAIKSCLSKIKQRRDISLDTLDYFMVNNPRLGRFYLLPKIHKRLDSVPGRPVVSNTNYYTENISAFLDHHLQPLSQSVKSYVKDTNDFLKRIRGLGNIPENAILCSVDVVGLYPSIPHDEGLEVLKKSLDKREDIKISTETLLELASLVLKNNYFEFNGEHFLQNQGTAIGTKMAPSYAILFMDDFETRFLQTCEKKPWIWWRYIDDIFLIWEHGETELTEFLEKLNSFHPTIKFTSQQSRGTLNFLDVELVVREDGTLSTDLYVKPTDTHQYLHSSSCHPYHCKKAIAYSQTLRLNRICSNGDQFDHRCNDLEYWLCERGYNKNMVRSQVLAGRKFSRNELLDQVKPTPQHKLTLNITYHPAFRDTRSILEGIHLLLTYDANHREVYPDIPVVGFRKAKSLKDFLVRAKLPQENVIWGCRKCDKKGKGPRCQVCDMLENATTFTDKGESKTYVIRQGPLDCNSKFVVYIIQCKVCGKQNCGSTITQCRTRINNYKTKFRGYKEKFLHGTLEEGNIIQQACFHDHFCQPEHNGISDWSLKLIDQAGDEPTLRKKESFWQHKLNTFAPNGLNEREVPLTNVFC